MATNSLLLWEAYFYRRNYLTPEVLENNQYLNIIYLYINILLQNLAGPSGRAV